MTETLTWIPVATKPDADITVLCWCSRTKVWFVGWFGARTGACFNIATGNAVEGVTHWAHVQGPQ